MLTAAVGLNGGPHTTFNEAISLMVNVKDQAELDYYWDALREGGGEEVECGWLKDKYGLRWQVVPENIMREMTGSDDREAAARAFGALMKMKKPDIAAIKKAFKGE
jgi:predicted 3-demethylubiquinone-9 3-methyltransferase (glyoxalase superfamily)